MNKMFGDIKHSVLKNGLRVIINPDHTAPKVSIQLWYGVGSKDEQAGEKGLAHLLEHMIFKGTKRLSESDINLITSKLSGYTNAFTSYDYTGYMFDFPKQHWTAALDLLADCMTNCTFDEDMLQSELKTVIQELKLYKDDYCSSLVEAMVGNMFPDHPYHHPIIGYKQDLWSIDQAGLIAFYKKHYRPNNATLVVVGAVDPQEALKEIETHFGLVELVPTTKKIAQHAHQDMQATGVTLYRDIQRPLLLFAWRVPGISMGTEFLMQVVSCLIGESKSSLLYQRLVDELHIATDVSMYLDDLFDHGVLFLQVDPIDYEVIPQIEQEIKKVLEGLHKDGVTDEQIKQAMKQSHTEYLLQAEEFQERAYMIGKGYLATGDPAYINKHIKTDAIKIKKQIHGFITTYMRPTIMHKGSILPLPASEKEHWLAIQQESDKADAVILSRKVRQTEVEPGRYVHKVATKESVAFDVPQHKKFVLHNGLPVLYHKADRGDKIEILVEFDAQYYCDPDHLQGLGNFVFAVMQEGTKNYTKAAFMQALASRGMHLDVGPGLISLTLLKDDLSYGLILLYELLEHALFDAKAIEKVRAQMFSDIDDFWDVPSQFVQQLAREHIYKQHPYSKRYMGTVESIRNITQSDLINYYKIQVTSANARIAIVGAFDDKIESVCQQTLESWSGSKSCSLAFPQLVLPPSKEIVYPIVRDQAVLALAGLSVDRHNPLYDSLLLFDQIFTGGAQHSMSSHLFQLREQTGLFYTIGGSLVFGADKQPGMFYIKTIVSHDRLAEAEKVIKQTMQSAPQRVTFDDIKTAKDAIAQQLVDQFATQKSIAQSFLFIERMQLPKDYFARRMDSIKQVKKEQLIVAAQQIMQPERVSTFKVGRL